MYHFCHFVCLFIEVNVNFVTCMTYHKQILISVSLNLKTSFHIIVIIIIAFISGNKAHINRRRLECGPMPNLMVTLPQSLANAHY